MSEKTHDWTTRPASEADVDALTEMLNSATTVFLDRPTTPAEAADRLAVPGCNLPDDSLLFESADGRVLGFAQVFVSPPVDVRAFARVHPDFRGQGIGTALARWTVGRASVLADTLRPETVRFSTTAWAGDSTAAP